MYYIFNSCGELVGSCDLEPSMEDLLSRSEYAVKEEIPLYVDRIVGGKYGRIYEIVETPEDITQQQTTKIVSQRNKLLTKFDWIVTRHLEEKMTGKDHTLSEEQFVEFLKYRQELRDINKLENFPFISLPQQPSFLE